MPDARTHDVITVLSAVALAPLYQTIQTANNVPLEAAALNTIILAGAHLVSGMFFSPDLDLDSRIDNRWGPLMWIWWPYMRVIPHRHFWSHSLVFSPLLRLLYFYSVLALLLSGGAWLLAQVGVILPDYRVRLNAFLLGFARDYPAQTWAVLLGFITGSAAHTIADWLVTKGKRFLAIFGVRITRDYRNHDRWVPRRW